MSPSKNSINQVGSRQVKGVYVVLTFTANGYNSTPRHRTGLPVHARSTAIPHKTLEPVSSFSSLVKGQTVGDAAGHYQRA